MKMSESIGGLHPAGCNLDSHAAIQLLLFIRLRLRNQPRLILSQTLGHFRQRVTHEALISWLLCHAVECHRPVQSLPVS